MGNLRLAPALSLPTLGQYEHQETFAVPSTWIYKMFESYLQSLDFVGADMARKYLQMDWKRAMRYANDSHGKKYVESLDAKTENLDNPYSSGSKNKGNQVLIS
jgi:Domain of unknown function (DUF4385)